ncbi:NAD-dependent epimerase/dehydratase family protein [Kineosporia sp. R_H_3]|uniref:NAD-dependent epimerase/dehydratase family protein n=1 Tax=Kineosporia sp. R_H_3 TaxID=1961848 RepID=UPI000B4AED69|nr:NAD-dependent epimerase/dehydratase family protein [Kineosporia sp. R_H_3]
MSQQQLHVVVGAGAVGTAVAGLLADAGHAVRVVTRSGSGPRRAGVELVAADAADGARLTDLARGATALYNCVNPPYHRWATDWPPIAATLLEAAESAGAVLATVSNLYVYGPVDAPMTESTPMAATGTKGRVRRQMWLDALAAHEAGRVRVTEVRGSDYLGPHAQSQITEGTLRRMLAGKAAYVLGEPDVVHTWTATRDVARTLVAAAATEQAWGRPWHVPSHDAVPVRQVVEDMCRVAGVPAVGVRRIPAVVRSAGRAFVPFLRELPEVMHQHERPWVMDSSAARAALHLEPTPWDDILREMVEAVRGEQQGRRAA